jgi:lysyl-tRNA synthetase, class II
MTHHPERQQLPARLRSEVRALIGSTRARWNREGWHGITLALIGAALIAFTTILRTTGFGVGVLDNITELRPDLPFLTWLLRVPGSLVAPAPRLPVWGSIGQVLIVVGMAELLLGRRRTLTIAIIAQFVTSLAGRVLVQLADHSIISLPDAQLIVRDTGPSAAVVALALALAFAHRLKILGCLVAAGLLLDAITTTSLAGYEHLIAVGCGVGLGLLPRHAAAIGVAFRRRVRLLPAAVVLAASLIHLILAINHPFGRRIVRFGMDALPFVSARHTRLAHAIIAYALVLLAYGLRRGQRLAWGMTLAALMLTLITPIRTALDVGQTVAAVALLLFLLWQRANFTAPINARVANRGITVVAGAATAAVSVVAFVTNRSQRPVLRPSLRHTMWMVAGRMAGRRSFQPHPRFDPFVTLVGVALAVASGWLLTRPASATPLQPTSLDRRRARRVVENYGNDTLAFFALRDDKQLFFHQNSVVAFAVHHGTALVSPDPIGPVHEREEVWAAFMTAAQQQGWSVAVLGASTEWLAVYEANDLKSMYIGDEAVVDCTTFHMDGGPNKALRQAVNRVAKYGYTISFHDPSHLDESLRVQLDALVGSSRRGEAERGFSMTLGRLFEPTDRGLLLAVCSDREGTPVAFVQYVPAAGIAGYSLDVMRRDRGERPNGLLDLVIVRTIEHVRDKGGTGLCLNFATMRGVLAGEQEFGHFNRLIQWALHQGSASMQIESLWKYNAKFSPAWQPRYAVYQAAADLPGTVAAMAKAEAIWELPVIGRFLKPKPHSIAA